MQTKPVLLNNRFKASQEQGFDADDESIVFISYKRNPDLPIAYKCAKELDKVKGIAYWVDEEDECLSKASSRTSKAKKAGETAKCIEKGLDIASALLGIIGPKTFDSSWVPYEIGGARGRQRFSISYLSDHPQPHPLIAHLIYGIDIDEAPDFVALGTPLINLAEVTLWARSVAAIIEKIQEDSSRKILLKDSKEIRSYHGVEKIYERNTRHFR